MEQQICQQNQASQQQISQQQISQQQISQQQISQQLSQQQMAQQMMFCPIRVVYETPMLMQPEQLQNQYYINPQNPPPWARPQNQVIYLQQLPSNVVPVQQYIDQNQLYAQNIANYKQMSQIAQNVDQMRLQQIPNMMPNVIQQNVASNVQITDAMGQITYGQVLQTNPANMNQQMNDAINMQNQQIMNQNAQRAEIQRQVYRNVATQQSQTRPNMPVLINQLQMPPQQTSQTFAPVRQTVPTQQMNEAPRLTIPTQTNMHENRNVQATFPNLMPNVQMSNAQAADRKPPDNSPRPNTSQANTVTYAAVRNGQTYTYRAIQPKPPLTTFNRNVNYSPMNAQNQTIRKHNNAQTSTTFTNTKPISNISSTVAKPNYVKSEDSNMKFNRKRKSESPDELHRKIPANSAVYGSITVTPKLPEHTVVKAEIGVNTSPVHKMKVKKEDLPVLQIYPMAGQVPTRDESKNIVQSVHQLPQIVQKPLDSADKDKLVRNTVFPQARGRQLTDKQNLQNNIEMVQNSTVNVQSSGGFIQNSIVNVPHRIEHVQNSAGNVQSLVGSVQRSVENVQNSVGNVQKIFGQIQYGVSNVQNTANNVESADENVQNSVSNIPQHFTQISVGYNQNNIGNLQNSVEYPQNSIGNPQNSVGNLQNVPNSVRNIQTSSTSIQNSAVNTPKSFGAVQQSTVAPNNTHNTQNSHNTVPKSVPALLNYVANNQKTLANKIVKSNKEKRKENNTEDKINATETTKCPDNIITPKPFDQKETNKEQLVSAPKPIETSTSTEIKKQELNSIETKPSKSKSRDKNIDKTKTETKLNSNNRTEEKSAEEKPENKPSENKQSETEVEKEASERVDYTQVSIKELKGNELHIVDGTVVKEEKDFVLTHVLDGFVIQESNMPFAIRKPLKEKKVNVDPKLLQHQIKDMKQDGTEKVNVIKDKSKILDISHLNLNEETQPEPVQEDKKEKTQEEGKPFADVKQSDVKTWTIDQLAAYLAKLNWDETITLLREHEIDGESLFLVSKPQLVCIGIDEEHADIICEFVKC